MKLLELDISSIPFGQPIPFALRGVGGVLLAGKGFVIRSQEDLKSLLLRGHTLYVDTDESGDAYRAYLAQLQAMLHSDTKLGDIAGRAAGHHGHHHRQPGRDHRRLFAYGSR